MGDQVGGHRMRDGSDSQRSRKLSEATGSSFASSRGGAPSLVRIIMDQLAIWKPKNPRRPLNAKLCTWCKVIEINDSDNGWESHQTESENHVQFVYPELHLSYDRSDLLPALPSISKTVETGCPFCAHLKSSILSCFGNQLDGVEKSGEIRIKGVQYEWRGGLQRLVVDIRTRGVQCSSLSSNGKSQLQRVQSNHILRSLLPRLSNTEIHRLVFPIRAYKGELVKPIFKKDYIADRPGPSADWLMIEKSPSFPHLLLDGGKELLPEVSEKLRFWHKQCTTKCDNDIEPLVPPTRLLDVGSLNYDKIRLVETSKPTSDMNADLKWIYAALSHCWGNPEKFEPPMMTTEENLSQRCEGISFEDLPRNYRDAIIVCRSLDIQYLWVDSLCIVQGDNADWERESLRMAGYYEHAYITMIPSVANSCHDGFLERSNGIVPPGMEMAFQSSQNSNVRGSYFIGSHDTGEDADSSLFYEDTAESRWGTRGWTFCEWLFSKRRVYFGENAIHWSCRKFYSSELSNIMEDAEEHNLESLIEEHYENARPDIGVWSLWYAQFLEYSCRKFTNARDRLPAISPLAKVVADMTGDEYLAGLWKNNLHVGLLWYSSRFEGRTFCLPGDEDYIAPSWSWLARARNAEISQYVVTHSITSHLKVLDAATIPDGLNPFGRVLEGHITIEGRVCAIPTKNFHEATNERDTTHKEIILEDKFVAECSFDQDKSVSEGHSEKQVSMLEVMPKTLFLLVVRDGLCLKGTNSRAGRDISEQDARSAICGLILTPSTRTEGEYLRIGIFESPPIENGGEGFFVNCETRTIIII